MFEFLRDLRKSDEEKRQEALSAYLDDALTPAEKERFERLLASDEALRSGLQEQRLIRASLRQLPRMRAPRNFTLDPALYGQPVDPAADRLYPIMRVATAVVAILFVLVLVIDLAPIGGQADGEQSVALSEQAADAVEEPAAAQLAPEMELEAEPALVEQEAIEVTRLVEMEEAVEEMVGDAPVAEAPAEESAAPAEQLAEEEAEMPSPEDAMGGGAPAGDEAPQAFVATPEEEGRAAEPETEEALDRAADEPPPPLATAGAAIAAKETAESTLTQEALASQPTPSQVPPPTDDGQAALGLAAPDTDTAEVGPGLSTSQILVVILGLSLVLLAVITLLLRRRAR